MIEKIISIKNIGRFINFSTSGDLQFRKLNLIYAENAKGKTTLCSILRSLKTMDPIHINERKTIGRTHDSEVNIRANQDNFRFQNGQWNKNFKDIEIFDPFFVTQNIYAGDIIQHDQKRNLHRFAFGEKAIELIQEIENINKDINALEWDRKAKIEKIKPKIRGDLDIEAFLNLPKKVNVDSETKEKAKELEALETKEKILNKAGFASLQMPIVPQGKIEMILSKTLETITESSINKVKQHIELCAANKGEDWISQGMKLVTNDKCPFCGRPLIEVEVFKAFKDYFSSEYEQLKTEVQEIIENVNISFSEQKMLVYQKTFSDNEASFESWKNHLHLHFPKASFDNFYNKWAKVKRHLINILEMKMSKPLENLTDRLVEDPTNSWKEYKASEKELDSINKEFEELNQEIQRFKKKLGEIDSTKTQNELILLMNTKIRYEKDIDLLCDSLKAKNEQKIRLEENKRKKRSELERLSTQLISKYQEKVNYYLENFGADFKIIGIAERHYSGTPRIDYALEINNKKVDLVLDESLPGPCFKNTLSSGDKTTLALSFFLAKLCGLDNIIEKIIIFDDPLSSLDCTRRSQTCQEILKFSNMVKQVVLFSHNPLFLRRVWEGSIKANSKTLCIKRIGESSILSEWNIVRETQGEYFQNYFSLLGFLEEGENCNLIDVARCIRPLLECNLRINFPQKFEPNLFLGSMIEKIRESTDNNTIYILKPLLTDLTDINEYTKDFHHGSESYDDQPPSESELRSYVIRTIKLIGGIYKTNQ